MKHARRRFVLRAVSFFLTAAVLAACAVFIFGSVFANRSEVAVPAAAPVYTAGAGETVPQSGAAQGLGPTALADSAVSPAEASVSVGGDVLIHATVYNQAKSGGGYDFTPYFSTIKGCMKGDMNIVNMEVPVDARGNNAGISSYPTFNAPREILDAVKNIGVTTLLNANNHALDKGYNGLVKSRQNLLGAGFDVIGTCADQTQRDTPFIKDVNGIKIGVAAYTDSTNGIAIPNGNEYCINKIDLNMGCVPRILSDVKKLRAAGAEFVMVSFHWGVEYQDAPAQIQKDIAQALAEGGADVIIGNHAHCVQPIKRVKVNVDGREKECLIIYALGNFFADQTGLSKAKTQESMIVNFKIARDGAGRISLTEASYMPTFIYKVTGKTGPDAFRLLPAGKYANAASRPAVFASDADWQKCRNAWARVRSVVGDDIKAVAE